MPIRIQCPNCQKYSHVPDSAIGKTAKCKCGTSFNISSSTAPAVTPVEVPHDLVLQPAIKEKSSQASVVPVQLARKSSSDPHMCPKCGTRSTGKFCGSCGHAIGGGVSSPSDGFQGSRFRISTSTALRIAGGIVAFVVFTIVGMSVRNFIVSALNDYRKEQDEQLRVQADADVRKKKEDEAAYAKWKADAPKRKAEAEAAEDAKAHEQTLLREKQENARQEALAKAKNQAEELKNAREEIIAQARKKAADEEKARQDMLAQAQKRTEEVPTARDDVPVERRNAICPKCGGTGVMEGYEVSGDTFIGRATASVGARNKNDLEMEIGLAGLGMNGGVKIGKPIWVPYQRENGQYGLRRCQATRERCDCGTYERNIETARAAKEQAVLDAAEKKKQAAIDYAEARRRAAPIYVLKDGRRIKAISQITTGDHVKIRDEDGNEYNLSNSEILDKETPGK